jgi:hypothetical protein
VRVRYFRGIVASVVVWKDRAPRTGSTQIAATVSERDEGAGPAQARTLCFLSRGGGFREKRSTTSFVFTSPSRSSRCASTRAAGRSHTDKCTLCTTC